MTRLTPAVRALAIRALAIAAFSLALTASGCGVGPESSGRRCGDVVCAVRGCPAGTVETTAEGQCCPICVLQESGARPTARGVCPAVPPETGASCPLDLTCSWGAHPSLECRIRASCVGPDARDASWQLAQPPSECDRPLLAAPCPNAPSTGTCDVSPGCFYADGTNCLCPPGRTWQCDPPPTLSPGCAVVAGNDGAPCNLENETFCRRETCGTSIVCRDGVWRWITETTTTTMCSGRGS